MKYISFNCTIPSGARQEEIRRRPYLSLEDARGRTTEYVDYYNQVRLNSAVYYLTPQDVLMDRVAEKLAVRQEKLDAARERRIRHRAEHHAA